MAGKTTFAVLSSSKALVREPLMAEDEALVSADSE